MADQQVPVEGTEDGGIVSSLFDTAKSVGQSASSTVSDLFTEAKKAGSSVIGAVKEAEIPKSVASFAGSAMEAGGDFVEKIDKARSKGFSSLFTPDAFTDDAPRPKKVQELDEKERKISEDLNGLDGLQQTKDLLSIGKKALSGLVHGSELKRAMVPGVDETQFNERVKSYQRKLEEINKNMSDIVGLDPKFSDYRSFQESSVKEYLAATGKATIDDEEDFKRFAQERFQSMDQSAQRLIQAQMRALEATTAASTLEFEKNKKEMEAFLNSSVVGADGKTGAQRYQEIVEKESKSLTESKWLDSINRIREAEKEKLETELSENAKILAKYGGINEETKDNVIDNMTARRQYYLALRGAKDIPNSEEHAERFWEGAEVFNKFDKDVLIAFEARKNSKEFDGLTDLEKRKKILAEEYGKLTSEQKKKMQDNEAVITGIDQYREVAAIKRMENPGVILNALSAMGSYVQEFVDKVYDYEKEGVPHYVEQETRSLVYAKEGWKKKLISVFTYNSDAIASVLIGTKGASPAAKAGSKLIDFVSKNVDKAGKIVGIPTKIGFTDGYLRVVPNLTKEVVEGLAYGAPADAIIDNLMVEAPTASTEEFNRITSAFFDPAFYGARHAVKRGYHSSSVIANSIMWKFMDGEKKQSIEDMFVHMKEKAPDLAESKEQVREKMEQMEKVFRSMYSPKEISDMFATKGKLYEFLSTNIRNMEENQIREVLSANGLGIRTNDVFGMTRNQFDDIDSLAKKASESSDQMTMQNNRMALRESLKQVVSYSEGKNHPAFMPLSRSKMNDNKAVYLELKKKISDAAGELAVIEPGTNEEVRAKLTNEIESGVIELQKNFSISQRSHYVYLIDTDSGNEFKIALEDFNSIEDMKNKNLSDLIAEGRVTVKNDELKGVNAGRYIVKPKSEGESADKFVKDYVVRNIEKIMDDFRATGLFQESDLKVNMNGNFKQMASGDGNIAQQYLYVIRNVFLAGNAQMKFITQKFDDPKQVHSAMAKVGPLIHGIAKDMFGEYVGKTAGFVNDSDLEISESTFKVVADAKAKNQKTLIEWMNGRDGYVNVNYGYFRDDNTKNLVSAVYLSFGKDMREKFPDIMNRVDRSDKGDMNYRITPYGNTVAGKLKESISRARKADGSFDLAEGFAKTNAVESSGMHVLFGPDGGLSFNRVEFLVSRALKSAGINDVQELKEISRFTYQMFSNADESMEPFMVPMIYNIAYKYAKNAEKIREIIKLAKLQGDDAYVKSFANLILDPKLFDAVASKGLKNKQGSGLKELEAQAEKQWGAYYDRLKVKSEELTFRIEEFKTARASEKDWFQKSTLDDSIRKMKSQKKSIDDALASSETKEKFVGSMMDKVVTRSTVDSIRAQADAAAYRALVEEGFEGEKEAKILSIEGQIKAQKEANEKLSKISSDEESMKRLTDWYEKVMSAGSQNEQRALLDHGFEDGPLKDYADFIANLIRTKQTEFAVYDIEGLRKEISNHFNGVYSWKFVRENNPVTEMLDHAITGSYRNRQENEMIRKAFAKEFGFGKKKVKEVKQEAVKEEVKKGFQGYVGGFSGKGKGTPEGDGKDEAMRQVSQGFIGEIKKKSSSSMTSFDAFNDTVLVQPKDNKSVTYASISSDDTGRDTIMLARNGEFGSAPLRDETKKTILEAQSRGAKFVVGDMPGVDSAFVDYLDEIGAEYKIYHSGSEPRIKRIQVSENQISLFGEQLKAEKDPSIEVDKLPSKYDPNLPRVSDIVSFVHPFSKESEATFESWLKKNKVSKEEYMRTSQEGGTYVHAAMEEYGKTGKWEGDKFQDIIKSGISWFDENNVKLVESEKYMKTDDYQGTADAIVEIDGKKWIIDFKSFGLAKGVYGLDKGYKLPQDKLKKAELQLSMYANIEDIDNIAVVELTKTGYKFHKLNRIKKEGIDKIISDYKKSLVSEAPVEKPKSTEEYETPKDLYELYHGSTKFKEFIDSLYSETGKIKKDWRKDVANVLKKVFRNSGINISVEGKDETESLIMGAKGSKGIASDEKLLKKIKSIRNYKKSDYDIQFREIEVENSYGKTSKVYRRSENPEYLESVMVMDELVAQGVPMRFIRGIKPKGFGSIQISSGDKQKSISTIVNSFYKAVWRAAEENREKLGISDQEFNTFRNKYGSVGSNDAALIVKALINGDRLPSQFDDPLLNKIRYFDKKKGDLIVGDLFSFSEVNPASARKEIRKSLGMKDSEILLWSFGDKDSTFRVYDLGENANAHPRVAKHLAQIHYQLGLGYYDTKGIDYSDKLDFEKFVSFVKSKKGMDDESLFIALKEEWFQGEKDGKKFDLLLDAQKVSKREAATMSNESTFDGIKIKLNTYVIDEWSIKTANENGELVTPKWLTKEYVWAIRNSQDIERLAADINESIETMRKYGTPNVDIESIASQLDNIKAKLDGEGYDEAQHVADVKGFMNNVYLKDRQDGTSFAGEDVAKMRGEIHGLDDKDVFKDHFFGKTPSGLFLGKTLFNKARMTDSNGNPIEMGVAIGASSAKLKAGMRKPNAGEEFIFINGRPHKVVAVVEGTDTQFFRNAATEAVEETAEQTVSNSIKNHLPMDLADQVTAIQWKQIEEKFVKLMESLGRHDIQVNAIGDVNEFIAKLSSEFKVGSGSESVTGAKVKAFLDELNMILEKPKEEGQSAYIRESSVNIKPNQVIMSRESKLVKDIKASQKKELDRLKEDPAANADEIKILEDEIANEKGLFASGFRYPVPSIYNLAAFEIIVAEKYAEPATAMKMVNGELVEYATGKTFNPYENLPENQIVPHPLVTYAKMEGDNDGDHIFLINARGDYGSVIGKTAIGLSPNEDLISRLRQGDFENDFIVVAQVEKDQKPKSEMSARELKAVEAEEERTKRMTLDERSANSLNAKTEIGTVSATIRTVDGLFYVFQKMRKIRSQFGDAKFEEYGSKKVLITNAEGKEVVTSYSELFEKYGKIVTGSGFAKRASSLLQATLDFANSGRMELSKDWPIEMLSKLNLGLNDKELMEFYHDVIAPISMGYNRFDLKDPASYTQLLKFQSESKRVNLGELAEDQKLSNTFKDVASIVGPKRDMVERLASDIELPNGKKMSFAAFVQRINRSYSLEFVIKEVGKDVTGTAERIRNEAERLTKRATGDNREYFSTAYTTVEIPKIGKDGNPILDANGKPVVFKKSVDAKKEIVKSVETMLGDLADTKVSIGKTEITFKQLLQNVKRLSELYRADKTSDAYLELKKRIFDAGTLSSMDRNQRFVTSLYATGLGEARPFLYFSEQDRIEFLKKSDKKFEEVAKDLGINVEAKGEYEDLLKDIDDDIGELLRTAKKEMGDPTGESVNDGRLADLIRQKEEIEAGLFKIYDEEASIKESVIDDAIPMELGMEFRIPDISFKDVNTSPQAVNEMISVYKDVASTQQRGIKLTLDSLFNKYMPEFYGTYNGIRSMLNEGIEMLEANKRHVYEFSDSFVTPKDTLYKRIKGTGLTTEKAETASKIFQRALLLEEDGAWKAASMEKAKTYLGKKFKRPEFQALMKLFDDPSFESRLADYQANVITPVAENLNKIQRIYGISMKEKYFGQPDHSIVTDTIEAFKNDPQLALKVSGIPNEETFMEILEQNAKAMETTIYSGTKRILRNAVYHQQKGWIDSTLGFLQSLHYALTYGTAATFLTQNNIFAGLAQVLPNYVEIKSYLFRNSDRVDEAWRIIQRYGLMDAENVLRFSSGFGKELRENRFDQFVGLMTKTMVEKAAGLTGVDRRKQIFAGEIVDSFTNNMLGFNDWPLENLRKMAAVMQTMDSWGVRNFEQLEEMFEMGGRNAIDRFNSHANSAFIQSGGGVVSSGIGRGTVFENSYEYFDILPVRFAVKSLGYLMSWSFHKAATMIEKEMAMATGIKLIATGDVRAGMAHVEDWFRYNSMLAKQIVSAGAIYLKFQKYEKDDRDRMTFERFRSSFVNAVVSLEILVGQHVKQWETAADLSPSDKAQYVAFGVVNRMFRLFKQPGTIGLAYDKYRADAANGEGDMAAALIFAIDKRYTAYMSMAGLQHADDVFNTVTNQSNLGLLGTGGATVEDELFGKLEQFKTFSRWKEKGSIMSFIDGFTGMFKGTGSNASYSVAVDMAKSFRDSIVKDPELSKLLNGGGLGSGEGAYDIANVLGKPGTHMSDKQVANLSEIWNAVKYGGYSKVDEKGRRVRDDGTPINESKEQQMLEELITKEFEKRGFDIESVIREEKLSPELVKILATLNLESNLKTPLVLSALTQMEEKRRTEALREAGKGILTGKVTGTGKYRKEWTELTDADLYGVRRDVLSKYQEYLNLDNTVVHQVIERHVRDAYGDKLDAIGKLSNFNTIEQELMGMLKSQQLITNNMKLYGDVSSVTKLQSRYALAMRGFSFNTEVGVNAAIKWMKDVEDAPWMDKKSKLAHQAAIVYGLNKTQYGILKNNEKFAELTEDSQRLLTNWLYKVSSESLDYDSKSYLNDLNASASKSSVTSGFNPYYKSRAFSGRRPNYGSQFNPVREMIPGKEGMLHKNPNAYLSSAYDRMPQRFGFNPARAPIMRDFQTELFRQTFFGFDSQGIVRTAKVKQEFQKQNSIKLKKKTKKSKQVKMQEAPRRTKVSKGLIGGMPIANYE